MRYAQLVGVLLLGALSTQAQVELPLPPYPDTVRLSTPYHAVVQHLYYLQTDPEKGEYAPEKAAEALYFAQQRSPKEKTRLAQRLKKILDGRGVLVHLEDLPQDRNYADSLGNKRYVLSEDVPEVFLEKIDGKWQFSRKTVREIDALYARLYPFQIDKALQVLPTSEGTFLKLNLRHYLAIALYLLVLFALYKLSNILLAQIMERLVVRLLDRDLAERYIYPVVRPFSIMYLILVLRQFVPALELPVSYSHAVVLLLKFLVPLYGVIVAYRAIALVGWLAGRAAERTEGTLDDHLVPLFTKFARVIVIIGGSLFIIDNLGWDITPVVAGISIGGLAFALAAQDFVGNLFGSLTIFMDKPFQIGDWIKYGDTEGVVEEVGFRATRVRTFYNSLVYIPNGELTTGIIDNYGLRQYRRFTTHLGLQYDTPPELIEEYVTGLRQIVRDHPATLTNNFEIHLNRFSASSVDVLLYIFFEVDSWSKELDARADVLYAALKLAAKLGVQYAFPTQTLHVTPAENPRYTLTGAEAAQAREGLTKELEKTLGAKWQRDPGR